jgi:hypothetical protein
MVESLAGIVPRLNRLALPVLAVQLSQKQNERHEQNCTEVA